LIKTYGWYYTAREKQTLDHERGEEEKCCGSCIKPAKPLPNGAIDIRLGGVSNQ
jgi:hypothetical protein